jgi:RNA polymerase sigma-70 factor (ECF subfamily)
MTQIAMKAPIDMDEASLVERARHDPAAFGALYDCYIERIYAYAARETGDTALAEDVTAATFEKALRQIPDALQRKE